MKKYVFIILWFFAISVPLAYAMSTHNLAFKQAPLLGVAKLEVIRSHQGQWQVVHFLSAECGCSKKVSQHLLLRKPVFETQETIFVLEGALSDEKELQEAGYHIQHIDSEKIAAEIDLDAVPQLVVLDPNLKVHYSGGYTNGSNPTYEDQRIIAEVRQKQNITGLPIFGCANSQALKAKVDPFSLKYAENKK